jgi:hypothetical protein
VANKNDQDRRGGDQKDVAGHNLDRQPLHIIDVGRQFNELIMF